MAYGTIKVDTITFTDAGVDKSVTISGLVQNPTFSGNITVTGTVSGNTIRGQTISGATITGGAAAFTTVTGGVATITSGVFALGSASNPSISFSGDPNSGLYSPGADQVAISTNGTGRLFIDASGNVGVGGSTATGVALRVVTNNTGSSQIYAVTSEGTIASDVTGTARLFYTAARTSASSFTLTNLRHYDAEQGTFGAGSTVTNQYGCHVNNLTGATNNFGFYSNITSGTGRWNFYSNGTADSYFASNNFIWANGGTERARIDSSGRLLVGTSTSISGSVGATNIQVAGTASTQGGLSLFRSFTTTVPEGTPYLQLGRNGGSNVGDFTAVISGSRLGLISFDGADGSAYKTGAHIYAEVDGTPGTNDMPGRLVFSTTADGASSPTERMRINSAGNVGIGTTSPNRKLTITETANADAISIRTADANFSSLGFGINSSINAAYIQSAISGTGTTYPIAFYGPSSEWGRFDTSGRLLVGTSIARNVGAGSGRTQIETTSYVGLSAVNNTNDTGGVGILLAKSRGTTVGGNTIVQSGDDLGSIQFCGADGSDLDSIAALIRAQVDGTPGANDMPGRLVFSTTADGASSPTERMRIQQNGTVLIGTTSAISIGSGTTDGVQIEPTALAISRDAQPVGYFRRRSSDGQMFQFFRDTTQVGNISVTTTATAYNTSSDYRLKENVVPLTGAANRLNQLQVHRFNFIADPDKTVDGFIAHEAQAVVPECVTGTKDEVDDEGNSVYQGIDQSKLVPLLTAALQEALQKIEDLETRLTAAGL